MISYFQGLVAYADNIQKLSFTWKKQCTKACRLAYAFAKKNRQVFAELAGQEYFLKVVF